jgi:hypothetical protein
MGFDGLFFARADYQDINKRSNSKSMEMIWKASANLGKLLMSDSCLQSTLNNKYTENVCVFQIVKVGYSLVFCQVDTVHQSTMTTLG